MEKLLHPSKPARSIGPGFRTARVAAGMSLDDAAQKLGATSARMTAIEDGWLAPTDTELQQIALALKPSAHHIIRHWKVRNPGMDKVPAAHRQQATALLAITEPVAGVAQIDADADYEMFWEAQFKLAAALGTFPRDHSSFQLVSNMDPELPIPLTESGNRTGTEVLWGPGPESVRRGHEQRLDVFAYWENQAFLRAAQREHLVCGVDPDDGSLSLQEASARLHAQGHTRQFGKGVQSKTLIMTGEIGPSGFQPDGEDVGWTLVRLEGRAGTIVLQPFTPMEYEYRFFVVNGIPVAGAGAVSEHTPFDSTGARFETRMRRRRRPEVPVENDPQRVLGYVDFATETAAAIFAENPEWDQFVLDVATGQDGLPLAVELNSVGPAGLFANDPVHIAQAVLG